MARPIRKKLVAIVEAPHLNRLLALLEDAGATGFTVIDGREGRGLEGEWRRADVVGAVEKTIVIAITNAETAEAVLAEAEAFFARYPGIIYAHDVEVVRGERF